MSSDTALPREARGASGGDAPEMPRSVAVVGLGLVGGSLVRALRALPDPPTVLGASPDPRDRAGAREAGVDARADASEVVGEADLVVYATPLAAILKLLPAHVPLLRPDAILTDVGGLKEPVLAAARSVGLVDRFVGGHPMAGGVGSGFASARVETFRGARVWLCGDADLDPSLGARVEALWVRLGARPAWIDAATHDGLMVRISHLPQLAANALALTLEAEDVDPAELGPGGRDMTRLAESGGGMWSDLFAHSGAAAAALLRALARRTDDLAARLEAGDVAAVAELMERTRSWRGAAPPGLPPGSRTAEPESPPRAGEPTL